jgi:oligopeptide transport system permease protein
MARFLISRLVQFPLILAIIYLTTFALVWLAPGDPFAMLNERNNPEAAEQLRRQFNADSPWKFLATYPLKLLSGEMGPSFKYQGVQVGDIIRDSLPVSLAIGGLAIVIASGVGIFIGTLAAVRRGGVLDWASLTLALIGVSVPSFVVAAALMTAFAYNLELLPLGGWPSVEGRGFDNPQAYLDVDPSQLVIYTDEDGRRRSEWDLTAWQWIQLIVVATPDYFRHMLLPAVALSLLPMAYITRLTRVSMIDVLGSEFVRTARAKGLSKFKVVFKHCLRNAILPVLSFLGPATANVLVGSFVVETIFVIPGLGPHFVASVQSRDQPLILGTVMIYSIFLLTLNLLVDIAYTFVDPRIEIAGKGAES